MGDKNAPFKLMGFRGVLEILRRLFLWVFLNEGCRVEIEGEPKVICGINVAIDPTSCMGDAMMEYLLYIIVGVLGDYLTVLLIITQKDSFLRLGFDVVIHSFFFEQFEINTTFRVFRDLRETQMLSISILKSLP